MKHRDNEQAGLGRPASKHGRGRNSTADRTADVLLLFDAERPVLSAALVASLLGMTRSTTYR